MKAQTLESQKSITPLKALELLKEGNTRFVNDTSATKYLLEQASETINGQYPFAVTLSCIDSRTSPEIIFDQGIGDIFSIRIAGNVVNPDIIGSLEFACKLAGSKLIVVLGHTSCGAIKGACDHVEMGNLTELINKIKPAVEKETATGNKDERNSHNPEFVENVTDINIKLSVKTIINRSEILKEMIEKGELAIIGAKHYLKSGKVEFFNDTLISNETQLKGFMG